MPKVPRKNTTTVAADVISTGRNLSGFLPGNIRTKYKDFVNSGWVWTTMAKVGGYYPFYLSESTWTAVFALFSFNGFVNRGSNPTSATRAGHFVLYSVHATPPVSREVTGLGSFDNPTANYGVVQHDAAVELWNITFEARTGSANPVKEITSFSETLQSAPSGSTPGGLAYDDQLSEIWWCWIVSGEARIYRNRELFETIPADSGTIIAYEDKVYFGGSVAGAAFVMVCDPFISVNQEGLGLEGRFKPLAVEPLVGFTSIWEEAGHPDFRLITGDASLAEGIWCWSSAGGGAGTLSFLNPYRMLTVHEDMFYGHVFGGDHGRLFFVDGSGSDIVGDGRGTSRSAVWDNAEATNVEMEYTNGNGVPAADFVGARLAPFRTFGFLGYGTVSQDNNAPFVPHVSVVPPEGWVLSRIFGDNYVVGNASSFVSFGRSSYGTFDSITGNSEHLSEPFYLELEDEETTVWLHLIGTGNSVGGAGFPASLQHSISFLINGVDYGPSPCTAYNAPLEGIVVPDNASNVEYSASYAETITHSITVNLPAGQYWIQGRWIEDEPNWLNVGPYHDQHLSVAIVDHDEEAEGYPRSGRSEFNYTAPGPVACDGQNLYSSFDYEWGGYGSSWGYQSTTSPFQLTRFRIRDRGIQTMHTLSGRDFMFPLVTSNPETNGANGSIDPWNTLVGLPNDSIACDGSNLFYATAVGQSNTDSPSGQTIRRCSTSRNSSHSLLYSATGPIKALSYHPVHDRLFFIVLTGGDSGLWSVNTSGGGATHHEEINFTTPAVYTTSDWGPGFPDGPGLPNGNHVNHSVHGQIGCAQDGSVWFRAVNGTAFSMNRWSAADGLTSVSSQYTWEVGSNTIPTGDKIISSSGPILVNYGNNYWQGSNFSQCVYIYSFVDGQIVKEIDYYKEISVSDDYAGYALHDISDYDAGTFVNSVGWGDYSAGWGSIVKIWSK